jgi:aspartate aminotransferase-like enzyme
MIGHRSTQFRELNGAILADVKELFRTKQHGFVATCSGTGLLEGALLNCVPRSVLMTTCGAFSERWLQIAGRLGLEADPLEHAWGEAIDPVRLANHLEGRRHHYDAVTITQNETSTGVINDVAALAAVVREISPDTLILVDAVSSLACAPLLFDEWGIDVAVASTQKGVALPPGLTLFAVSERSLERAAKRSYGSTYFDFNEFKRQAETGGAPFTPSIPHYFALAKQLDAILRSETLEKRWERHANMRALTLERTASYANRVCPPTVASPSVTTLRPKSMTGERVVAAMKEHGFTLGSGYGKWRESTFRIGHMGDIPIEDLSAMLDVLDQVAAAGVTAA